MKRVGILMLLFLMFSGSFAYAEEPLVGAQGAVLIDGKTGRMLWGKNAEEPLAMASTTKIMTAILVLELAGPEDVVTVSKNAARQPEVHMDLKEGEQWKVKDLLSAMMLRSYNDTAVALAEHIGGNVENFCAMMTEKAKEIGAQDTIFASPNGLDSQFTPAQHHSTAYDMALITAYALNNPAFCEVVGTGEVSITTVDGGRMCQVTNTDRFLREYTGALGVKTGYTNRAGHCFVGAAERGEMRLVSTVLGSGWGSSGKEKKWTDTKKIMDYGFENFLPYQVVAPGTSCGQVQVLHSNTPIVEAFFAEGYEGLFSKEEQENIEVQISMEKNIEAPVAKGQVLGRARILLGEEVLGEIPILSQNSAPTYTIRDWYRILAKNWVTWF